MRIRSIAAVLTCLLLTGAVAVPASRAAAGRARSPVSAGSVERVLGCAPSRHTAKPTVVLVHGAWADTQSWTGEVARLTSAGYAVRAIGNPLTDLTTDAQTVRQFLRSVHGPVVLAGHSYGGSVITNAATGLSNVKALVYVDAAAPAAGETTAALSGSTSALNAPASTLFDLVPHPGSSAKDMYLKKQVFVTSFGSDLPRTRAERLWAQQRAASANALGGVSKTEAWRTIPSWYFISTGDRIITPASERAMAARAHSTVTTFRGGSHLTLVSHPAAVTRTIGKAICASAH